MDSLYQPLRAYPSSDVTVFVHELTFPSVVVTTILASCATRRPIHTCVLTASPYQ
ncbi:hypothetical protein LK411_12715 [Tsukamurella paurometabola]|uniref:hypothetical protein n=1 Tax=Tsukamurella paurometabola TaxID=2061 RepID=UPI001D14B86E|nr:hypothetical protein [Tsukamurella paurometabola]UEA81278.1 hypothetical protein LK411_12715 [Tsukamurella paurometabola]